MVQNRGPPLASERGCAIQAPAGVSSTATHSRV